MRNRRVLSPYRTGKSNLWLSETEGSIDLWNWKIQLLTKPNWIQDSQLHSLHVQHPSREGKYLAQDHISEIRMGTAVSKRQILMLSHGFLWWKEKEAQSSLLRINFPLNYTPIDQWRFMPQCLRSFCWYLPCLWRQILSYSPLSRCLLNWVNTEYNLLMIFLNTQSVSQHTHTQKRLRWNFKESLNSHLIMLYNPRQERVTWTGTVNSDKINIKKRQSRIDKMLSKLGLLAAVIEVRSPVPKKNSISS